VTESRGFSSSFDEAWRAFEAGYELVPMSTWRERMTAGRAQFLSFQVPLGELAIADAIEELQDELADIDGLRLYEREILHISLRRVGFQVVAKTRPDDVTREDVGRVTQRAAALLRGAKPVDVAVGPMNVFPGALFLEVRDGGALGEIRSRLAGATDDAFGIAGAQYLPHVTIAMFGDTSCAGALRERPPRLRLRAPATGTIKRIELARWWFTGGDADFPERDPVLSYPLRG
jgi:2'-5' RNA ligase